MPFTEEDRILIKHYRLDKGYKATRILKEFPFKDWSLGGLKKLLNKIDRTGKHKRLEVRRKGTLAFGFCCLLFQALFSTPRIRTIA